ncbi:MAG TPA: rod shape-determining protein RodA [Vicinamibacteria bacterium]|jgi:rod shape determining protein RodA|nr:rod shape-determining protein RodA [Vicinamibacteria bacterium]
MAIDRRLLVNVDWVLLGVTLLLTGLGVLTILSAAHSGHGSGLYLKQLYLVGLGLPCLLVSLLVDYRRLADRAVPLYLLAVGALLYVLFFGPRIAATRRWISLGSFHGTLQLQPSELVKLVAALFVAKVFAESRSETLGLRDVVGPGAAVGLLALLIAAEPDLGTAFCLIPLFLSVAFLAGLRMKAVLALFVVLLMVGGLGWQFALKDYQKTRIYTFLDPSLDPKGAGYQKIQSQIAVGSGGLLGKGYKQGSQAQLGYLPARHTDFVFSVLAEEMGFVGVLTVLALYLLLLWRMLETAQLARDRVGAFLAAGIAATFAFQVVYNVAMVAGLLPVKGLPLPLMSYGGSSILSSLLAVGLILNVRMRRFAN